MAMGAALERVDDHDSVDCRREAARFVDNELKAIAARSNERHCRSVEFRRSSTRSSASLDRRALLDVLRPAEDRELCGDGSRTDEKNDAARVRRVLIEPSC